MTGRNTSGTMNLESVAWARLHHLPLLRFSFGVWKWEMDRKCDPGGGGDGNSSVAEENQAMLTPRAPLAPCQPAQLQL